MAESPLLCACIFMGFCFVIASAKAQEAPPLNNRDLHGAAPYGTPIVDDRLYVHGVFNQLEGRIATNSYFRWDGQAWAGNDFNKLWVKSEGRVNADTKCQMSDGDQEFLYDRPISTYFNVQAGVRSDLDSMPNRTWAAVGIQGLAVGNWNVELTGYASTEHRLAVKTNASWDYRFNQRLILQPQFETNFYTRDEFSRGVGAGLSDIDSGLRLRYEFSRKVAPYIGVTYQSFFFNTAAMRHQSGSAAYDVRGVLGLRTWF